MLGGQGSLDLPSQTLRGNETLDDSIPHARKDVS